MEETNDADRPAGPPGPARLKLTKPADVLAAIPYLLGFHPTDSAVVMALRGKETIFNVRADLPPPGCSDDDLRSLVEHVTGVVQAQDATGAIVVGYGPQGRVTPVVRALERALTDRGLAVLDALRAADGRYWSYLCREPTCCPPTGTPYDPTTTAVAAEATLAGCVALPDRQEYANQLRPVDGLDRIAMRRATARASARLIELLSRAPDERSASGELTRAGRRAVAAAVDRHLRGGRLDDDEVAWLTVLLTCIRVRDVAWRQITGGIDELERHRALWLDVLRRAEPDLVAAPGSLFAFAAWRCGDGPLARMALDRVLREQPDYSLARNLADCLDRAVPPSSVLTGWPDDPGPIRRRPGRRPRRRSSSRRAGTRRR